MRPITLYFINWNDSFYLPFIKKHYGKFCQRIVMYDNYSTDNSREIAESFGMEVRLFGEPDVLNDQYYLDIKNNCWKESRGKVDYVIVCDADEFLIGDFQSFTDTCPKVWGYNMISDNLPEKNISEITTGVPDDVFNKQIIFNPNKIYEINYVYGCHQNNKIGQISSEKDEANLLHMRMIGGFDRLIDRHNLYQKRLSDFNKNRRLGFHYVVEDNHKRINWNYLQEQALDLKYFIVPNSPHRAFLL
jgi:hypothetical protein